MLTIRTLIQYAPVKEPEPLVPHEPDLPKGERTRRLRLARAAKGLCRTCGGERPCSRCSARLRKARQRGYL